MNAIEEISAAVLKDLNKYKRADKKYTSRELIQMTPNSYQQWFYNKINSIAFDLYDDGKISIWIQDCDERPLKVKNMKETIKKYKL